MKRVVTTVLLLTLAGLLFWQAGVQQAALAARRQQLRPGDVGIAENMPPLVAFTTVALGGFRGLIADALWLRATRLQDEGKYFEIVQLSDWITKLEPRFTAVWGFHAWNMAYNVSVLFDSPADRWRWVSSGIRLLRDEGLLYNPGSAKLYWELGWIYQHKMGQNLDQGHMFYKMAWLYEMANLFDGPTPDYEALAAAAHTPSELRQRPGVADFLAELEAQGVDAFTLDTLLPEQIAEDLRNLIRNSPPGKELVHFLQRRRMVRDYKLDPEYMQEIDENYGPLDWRMPEAHAIYWARRGRKHADDFTLIQLDRMVFQSMSAAFRTGTAFLGVDGSLIPSPNLEVLPHVLDAFDEALAENAGNSTIKTAHFNYLSEAISILYAYHRVNQAKELYAVIRERYADQVPADMSLDAFVIKEVAEQMEQMTSRQAHSLVEGMLTQSYLWYAIGDTERSAGSAQLARLMYQKFQSQFSSDDHRDRVGLPPIEELRRQAFQRILQEVPSEAALARLRALPSAAALETPPPAAATTP